MIKNRRLAGGRRGAVTALIASGIFWGTSVPLSKLALGWLGPGWLTVVRFGVAAVILVLVASRRRPDGREAGGLRGAFTLPVLASGVIGYGLSVVVQNAGLARTSVTHASLIIGAAPILVAIIAALWQHAVARTVAWAGFTLSLGGVALIAGGQGYGASPAGDTLVLAAVLLSASVTVAQGRLLEGRDPIALTAVQFVGAALAALPFAAAEGMPAAHPGMVAVLAAAGLTITGTLVPFSLFALGQKKVSTEVAGAFLNLEPLVGAMTGVVAFGDPAGLRQLGGGTAILAGIGLSSLPLLALRQRATTPPGAPATAASASAPAERVPAGVVPIPAERPLAGVTAEAGRPLAAVAAIDGATITRLPERRLASVPDEPPGFARAAL